MDKFPSEGIKSTYFDADSQPAGETAVVQLLVRCYCEIQHVERDLARWESTLEPEYWADEGLREDDKPWYNARKNRRLGTLRDLLNGLDPTTDGVLLAGVQHLPWVGPKPNFHRNVRHRNTR